LQQILHDAGYGRIALSRPNPRHTVGFVTNGYGDVAHEFRSCTARSRRNFLYFQCAPEEANSLQTPSVGLAIRSAERMETPASDGLWAEENGRDVGREILEFWKNEAKMVEFGAVNLPKTA
jgi:hypothetical protein